MAMTDEEDAGFFVTGQSFGAAAKTCPVASTHQRIVDRTAMAAGGHNTPVGRPAGMIDSRVVFRHLDLGAEDAVDAAAANCTTTFRKADGSGTGSIVHGPMVPGNVDWSLGHAEVHVIESEYLLKGDALVETTTI